jgi:hypothetical protein
MMLLAVSTLTIAFTLGPIPAVHVASPARQMITTRMDDAPAPPVVEPPAKSSPEVVAANKAQYEANKVPTHASTLS